MAQVFISHAHSDESLAREVAVLIGDALALAPGDFFLSSQEGRGVAPAASIRASIMNELRSVPALVVLLTPKAAASPWVWLEAGSRLGSADRATPIIIVPSARFVPLLAPVADLRCLQMDNDGELHELVRAIGRILNRTPLDFLNYKPALEDVVQHSAQAYSLAAERRERAMSWVKGHVVAMILVAAGLGTLAYGIWLAKVAPPRTTEGETLQRNEDFAKTAAKFLKMKGKVKSAQSAVQGATVMVSPREKKDPSTCQEPDCTMTTTTSKGEFVLDLTKIKVSNDETVVISVVAPEYAFYSENFDVDVRATNQGDAPLVVTLSVAPSPR